MKKLKIRFPNGEEMQINEIIQSLYLCFRHCLANIEFSYCCFMVNFNGYV